MKTLKHFLIFMFIFLLVSTSVNFSVNAQDNPTTQPMAILGKYGGLNDMAWSPDSSTLAVSTYTGIVLYDNALNEVDFLEPTSALPIAGGLAWSPDGSKLFSANGIVLQTRALSNEVYIWTLASGEIAQTLTLDEQEQVNAQAWNQTGDKLVLMVLAQQRVQTLLIWDAETGDSQKIDIVDLNLMPEIRWRWSDDGQSVETVVNNEKLTLVLANPTEVERTPIDESSSRGLSLSPDNNNQAQKDDGTFVITNANGDSFTLAGDETGRFRGFTDVNWSANSERVAVWGRGPVPNIMVADVVTGEILLEFTYDEVGSILVAHLSPNGDAIALTTHRGELLVYNFETDTWHHRWFNGSSTSVSFSPDGTKLVTVNASTQNVYIWDAVTGEELAVWQTLNDPKAPINYIFTVAWSPDGNYVATGSVRGGQVDGVIESRPIDLFIWSAESGEVVQIVPALAYDADIIAELNWSEDSQTLAYSTISNQTGHSHIGVYNLQTEALYFQTSTQGTTWDIALHPNGEILALTWLELDNPTTQQVLFMDGQTGDLLDVSIPDIEANIRSVDWHPSGEYLTILLDNDDVFQVQNWAWQADENPELGLQFDLEGESDRSSLEWNEQGTQIATWYFGEDNAFGVQVWNVSIDDNSASLNSLFLSEYPSSFIYGASFDTLTWSADGSLLATSLSRNTSSIWEVPSE